uniref:lysozyme n=1 Tax=Timema bartmani TaxID=61472 RepID=A0A7R9I3W0_9NEOP|nr:unnamed protein product [Timema bartmani]
MRVECSIMATRNIALFLTTMCACFVGYILAGMSEREQSRLCSNNPDDVRATPTMFEHSRNSIFSLVYERSHLLFQVEDQSFIAFPQSPAVTHDVTISKNWSFKCHGHVFEDQVCPNQGFQAIFCLVATSAQQQQQLVQGETKPVNDLCLGCICEAVSNCNRSFTCAGDVCGLFRITWAYWSDAGKPVLQQDHPDNQDAYVRCVTDPFCAARAVQGYMTKFSKDCNGDGRVDCFDYAAIHRLGGYGCNGALDFNYQNKFQQCQAQVALLSQG